MAAQKGDGEELEVTVEVLPQTVNDIVYMSEEAASVSSLEDNTEDEQAVSYYQARALHPANATQMPLVLDETQTFVILPQHGENIECTNVEYTITPEGYLKKLDDAELMCIYSCHICNYKCMSVDDLDSHVNMCKQRSRDKYVCNVCGEIFERAQVLSHHFKTKHQKPVPVCNICGCPCTNEAALSNHYRKHEPKAFCCDVCEAEYDNAVALNNHLKTHTTTLLYACNKCDAGFSSTSEISVHLRTVHANSTAARRKNHDVERAEQVQIDSRQRATKTRKVKHKPVKNRK